MEAPAYATLLAEAGMKQQPVARSEASCIGVLQQTCSASLVGAGYFISLYLHHIIITR